MLHTMLSPIFSMNIEYVFELEGVLIEIVYSNYSIWVLLGITTSPWLLTYHYNSTMMWCQILKV